MGQSYKAFCITPGGLAPPVPFGVEAEQPGATGSQEGSST